MIEKIFVLGSGVEGCIAAVMLKARLSGVQVTLVGNDAASSDGEPLSTAIFGPVLQRSVRPERGALFAATSPVFSLGTRYFAGRRRQFQLPLVNMAVDDAARGLSRAAGYYYGEEDFDERDLLSAVMSRERLFFNQGGGLPKVHDGVAYTFGTRQFVKYLREMARSLGVTLIDERVVGTEVHEKMVKGIVLESGRELAGDLYIDATGAASTLLGGALDEAFESAAGSLPCDRVIEGMVPRGGLPLKPFGTCETQAAGWSIQKDLATHVVHTHLYCSRFVKDEVALAAFKGALPTVEGSAAPRELRCGKFKRRWVGNVIGVGAAATEAGPLHGMLDTAVQHVSTVIETLLESERDPSPTQIDALNDHHRRQFDAICGYLAILHRFNDRMQTPFWTMCQSQVELGKAKEIVDFYRENGPTAYWGLILIDSADPHPLGAYLTLLQGLKVPFQRTFVPPAREMEIWRESCRQNQIAAGGAMTPAEVMSAIASPQWKWNP